jgi:hypothetical protein
MAARIKTITPLEAWILERSLQGMYIAPAHLRKVNAQVAALVAWLAQINAKDRRKVCIDALDREAREVLTRIDPEAAPPTAGERTYDIVPAAALHTIPPLTWLVDREIPTAGLSVMYGESGTGKSFLALDYALRIAQSNGVLYIPSEGEAGYRKRVAAWCEHHRMPEGGLQFLFGAFNLIDPGQIETLNIDLQYMRPSLVVVDTLAMAMIGGDENSTRDMGMVMAACRQLARQSGTAVMLVHHIGRGGQHERGSTALRGNADTMIKVSQADDLVQIDCTKTKDEAPFPTRFVRLIEKDLPGIGKSLVPIPAEMVIRTAEDPLSPRQAAMLECLALETMRDGATVRDIADHSGLALSTAHRVLSNLIRLGYVSKPHGYVITDVGLAKIGAQGSVPSVPSVPRLVPQKTANSPRVPSVPLVPRDFENSRNGTRGTRGTSGTREESVEQEVEQMWNSGTLDEAFSRDRY